MSTIDTTMDSASWLRARLAGGTPDAAAPATPAPMSTQDWLRARLKPTPTGQTAPAAFDPGPFTSGMMLEGLTPENYRQELAKRRENEITAQIQQPTADLVRTAAQSNGYLGNVATAAGAAGATAIERAATNWQDLTQTGFLNNVPPRPESVGTSKYFGQHIQGAEEAAPIADTVDPVTKFVAGLPAMLPALADPEAIASMILTRGAGGLSIDNPLSRRLVSAVGEKYGPKVAGIVANQIAHGSSVGAFSGAQTGMEGGGPGDIARSVASGFVAGQAFAAPSSISAGLRAPAADPNAPIPLTDQPAPAAARPAPPKGDVPVQETIPLQPTTLQDWQRWAGTSPEPAPEGTLRAGIPDAYKPAGGAGTQTVEQTRGPLPVEPGGGKRITVNGKIYQLVEGEPSEKPTIPVQDRFTPTENADRGPWQQTQHFDTEGQIQKKLPAPGQWFDPSEEIATTPSPGYAPDQLTNPGEKSGSVDTSEPSTGQPIIKTNDANAIPRRSPVQMTTALLRKEVSDYSNDPNTPHSIEGVDQMDRATLVKAVKALRELVKQQESPDGVPARQSVPDGTVKDVQAPDAQEGRQEGPAGQAPRAGRGPERQAVLQSPAEGVLSDGVEVPLAKSEVSRAVAGAVPEWVLKPGSRGKLARQPVSGLLRDGAFNKGDARGADDYTRLMMLTKSHDLRGELNRNAGTELVGIDPAKLSPGDEWDLDGDWKLRVADADEHSVTVEAPRRAKVGLGAAATFRVGIDKPLPGNRASFKPEGSAAAATDAAEPSAKEPWQMTRSEWSGELDRHATDWQGAAKEGSQKRGDVPRTLRSIEHKRRLRMGLPDTIESDGDFPSSTPADHRAVIAEALRQGKPVPAEVLAEYPDLNSGARADSAPAQREPYQGSFKPVAGQQKGLLGERYDGGITGKQEGLGFTRPSAAAEEAAQRAPAHPSEQNTGRLRDLSADDAGRLKFLSGLNKKARRNLNVENEYQALSKKAAQARADEPGSPPLIGMGAASMSPGGDPYADWNSNPKMAQAVDSIPLAEEVAPKMAERFRQGKMNAAEFFRYYGNRLLPTIAKESPDAAQAVGQMANYRAIAARNAAEIISKILGKSASADPKAALAGKVLVEANLRGVANQLQHRAGELLAEGDKAGSDALMKRAAGVRTTVGEGGAFESEKAFQAAGTDPDVRRYVALVKQHLNPKMDANYRASRGLDPDAELQSRGDEDHGTRINLMALSPDMLDPAKGVVPSAKRGFTNNGQPYIISKNQFAREATGGGAAYASNLADIINNSMLRSTKAATERAAHDALQKAGMGFYDSQGGVREIDGHKWYPHRIENIPANDPGAYFMVRDDIKPSFDRARNATRGDDLGFVGGALKAPIGASVFGPLEPKAHIANMMGFMASVPFRGTTALEKVAEAVAARNAIPGVSQVGNLAGRLAVAARGVTDWAKQTPDALEHARKLAEGAAWKESEQPTWTNPLSFGNNVINSVSNGMRIAGSRMYDEMIKREGAPDTPIARGNFVNKFMGQYNENLQGSIVRFLRRSGLQPFAVPLKTAQQVAADALTGDPGFKAATAGQRARLGLEVAAGIASPIVGVAAANLATSKTPWGRPGVPFGAIDLGTDDDKGRPMYTDAMLTFSGVRKIMRTTGVDGFLRKWKDAGFDTAMSGGLGQAGVAGATQIGDRGLRAFTGPGVATAYESLSGREPTIESRRISPVVPEGSGLNQFAENLKGAAGHTLSTLGLVAPDEGDERTLAQRFLPGVLPQSGRDPGKVADTMKIGKAIDLNAYTDDLVRRAKRVDVGSRVAFVTNEMADAKMPVEDQQQVLAKLFGSSGHLYDKRGLMRQ